VLPTSIAPFEPTANFCNELQRVAHVGQVGTALSSHKQNNQVITTSLPLLAASERLLCWTGRSIKAKSDCCMLLTTVLRRWKLQAACGQDLVPGGAAAAAEWPTATLACLLIGDRH